MIQKRIPARSLRSRSSVKGNLGKLFACMLGTLLVVTSFVACSPKSSSDSPAQQAQHYTAGTYTGTGSGNGGDITVEVTFSDTAIESIDVVSQAETPTVAAGALESLPSDIVKYQSLGVDTVSGATLSSMGLINAISDAVTQAGGDIAALKKAPAQEQSSQTVEKQADAIVVGGGGSGMAAAIRLQELGKNVILVEKTYRLGGSISVSGGNQVVQGSALQQEAGVTDDSADSMIEDFQANGENLCVPELIDLYANNIGATTDWIHDFCGVQYNMEGGLHDLAEYSHNRELAYAGGGAGATESLRSAIADSGAEVLLNTTAESLISENGAVTGITAKGKDGTTYTLKADAVVLATGGYGNSEDWLTDQLKNDSLYYGLASSTGDGLTMATADGIDAATRMIEYAKLYPNGVEVSSGRAKSTIDSNILVWPMSTILVNPEGQRVVNEKASNHTILEAELQQTDSMLYLLMDSENFDVWRTKLSNTGFSEKAVEGYLDANGSSTPVFAHADTVAELAQIVGMDPAVLQQTIDTYNAAVESGVDAEFGRSGQYLQNKIGAGPYYLVEQKPRYATTMGGLVVDKSLQVLNTNNQVIEGLYASGEVVGGVMGSNSPSGANNGWALTSGKLAAEAIAKQ